MLVAVVLNVWAPHVLGQAMDVIFGGLISRDMPAGLTREQVIEGLRGQGQGTDVVGPGWQLHYHGRIGTQFVAHGLGGFAHEARGDFGAVGALAGADVHFQPGNLLTSFAL